MMMSNLSIESRLLVLAVGLAAIALLLNALAHIIDWHGDERRRDRQRNRGPRYRDIPPK